LFDIDEVASENVKQEVFEKNKKCRNAHCAKWWITNFITTYKQVKTKTRNAEMRIVLSVVMNRLKSGLRMP